MKSKRGESCNVTDARLGLLQAPSPQSHAHEIKIKQENERKRLLHMSVAPRWGRRSVRMIQQKFLHPYSSPQFEERTNLLSIYSVSPACTGAIHRTGVEQSPPGCPAVVPTYTLPEKKTGKRKSIGLHSQTQREDSPRY